jgi:hypothetical protein
VIFLNVFAESQIIGSWQRNLCQIFFSLPRVFYLALGKEASVPSVFSVPGVLYFALGKAFFAESFYFALGTEMNSRQSLGFR